MHRKTAGARLRFRKMSGRRVDWVEEGRQGGRVSHLEVFPINQVTVTGNQGREQIPEAYKQWSRWSSIGNLGCQGCRLSGVTWGSAGECV